ncbi:unnamed protein product [Prorocentrum cordatum]|uniref:Uncharacterized protein n=1 Tax=Prorocentrum cordatum TaxID=2364126 RepID=A0ABN9TDP5_9DINO|nr:unnamed protein product [Polarella glacialis]
MLGEQRHEAPPPGHATREVLLFFRAASREAPPAGEVPTARLLLAGVGFRWGRLSPGLRLAFAGVPNTSCSAPGNSSSLGPARLCGAPLLGQVKRLPFVAPLGCGGVALPRSFEPVVIGGTPNCVFVAGLDLMSSRSARLLGFRLRGGFSEAFFAESSLAQLSIQLDHAPSSYA